MHWAPCSLWIPKDSAPTVLPLPPIHYKMFSLYWVISKNIQTCSNISHLHGKIIPWPHISQQPQPCVFVLLQHTPRAAYEDCYRFHYPILSWIHSNKVSSQYLHRIFSGYQLFPPWAMFSSSLTPTAAFDLVDDFLLKTFSTWPLVFKEDRGEGQKKSIW